MKLKKFLGHILTILGGVVLLIGIVAAILPNVQNRQMQLIVDSFRTPSDHWLIQSMNNGFTFAMNHVFLMILLGLVIIAAGILLMIGLFCIYEGKNGAVFAPKWWGILGLIGWTYLVTTIVFLIVRTRLVYMTLAWLLFLALTVLSHNGMLDLSSLPSDMTHHALGVSGVFASVLLIHWGDREHPFKFIGTMIGLGVLMMILFFVSHPYWIISKIQATPTWLFVCNAISFFMVAFFYYLTDVKRKTDWFMIIKPAGTVTLTCYIIPYFWYAVQRLLAFHYPSFLCAGVPGLCRSLLFSLVVVWIAGALMKVNVRLKI